MVYQSSAHEAGKVFGTTNESWAEMMKRTYMMSMLVIVALAGAVREAAAQAGCKPFLGRPTERMCDARGYEACKQLLLGGKLTVCLITGDESSWVRRIAPGEVESDLLKRGCTREKGNVYACPPAGMPYCTGYHNFFELEPGRDKSAPTLAPVSECTPAVADIEVTPPDPVEDDDEFDTAAAMALEGVAKSSGWGVWYSLGGKIKGEPSLVRYELKGQDAWFVAARGDGDELWWRTKVGKGAWSDWASAGGTVKTAPACVSRADDVVDCFVVGSNFRLAQRSYIGGAWGEWSNPSSDLIIKGGLSAYAADAEHLTVVAGGYVGDGEMKTYVLDWVEYNQGSLGVGIPLGPRAKRKVKKGHSDEYKQAGWRGWYELDIGTGATAGFTCDGRFRGVPKGGAGRQLGRLFEFFACTAPDPKGPTGNHALWLFHGDRIKGVGLPPKSGGDLPGASSPYPLAIRILHTKADGVYASIAFTGSDRRMRLGKFIFGKGWKLSKKGKPLADLNGALASGPSCVSDMCAAAGVDNALWITQAD